MEVGWFLFLLRILICIVSVLNYCLMFWVWMVLLVLCGLLVLICVVRFVVVVCVVFSVVGVDLFGLLFVR